MLDNFPSIANSSRNQWTLGRCARKSGIRCTLNDDWVRVTCKHLSPRLFAFHITLITMLADVLRLLSSLVYILFIHCHHNSSSYWFLLLLVGRTELFCYIARCYSYTRRVEFVADALQVFENCEVFNEDDSPVGQAGHIMRKFFFLRYEQLVGEPAVKDVTTV